MGSLAGQLRGPLEPKLSLRLRFSSPVLAYGLHNGYTGCVDEPPLLMTWHSSVRISSAVLSTSPHRCGAQIGLSNCAYLDLNPNSPAYRSRLISDVSSSLGWATASEELTVWAGNIGMSIITHHLQLPSRYRHKGIRVAGSVDHSKHFEVVMLEVCTQPH